MAANAKQKKGGKGKSPPPLVYPAVVTAHGQEERYRRGEIDVVDAIDPSSQTGAIVRRATSVSATDFLLKRKVITQQQWLAACRYQQTREAEVRSITAGYGESMGRNPSPWLKSFPAQTQVQASAHLRQIHQRLSKRARSLVTLLVIDNLDMPAIAARLGEHGTTKHAYLMGELKGALSHLVEIFGLETE